ncbi:DASH family cryptochrome [Spirosoma agri]|uniref:Cryptochrome DASH n=1 Tax=Spirosoma agri TaxID=1987381 RepID=A0A6M0IRV1_9BACT|nr:DASH family cryptochrome [Spirosoma agri]NEU70225.1 DASH family cryptochrome [Spirosoma agri]
MQTTIIHWFRNDLRLHDNAALYQACQDAQRVLPVFIFDPASIEVLPDINVPKAGSHRTRFLLESLADLRRSLRLQGSDLVIRLGDPGQVLAELVRQHQVSAIYAGQEATSEEIQLEERVQQALQPLGVPLKLFWMLSLYHLDDLPFDVSELPDAYRDFRKGCEKQATVRDEVPMPSLPTLPQIAVGRLPTLKVMGLKPPKTDRRAVIHFVGGETSALHRVATYFWERDQLRNYKYTRNQLLGEDYSSKFSVWLANGCLSPRRVYWEVRRYEAERKKNISTYWLIFELIWRDYLRFQAARQGFRIFLASGPRNVPTRGWKKDYDRFAKWAAGQTGIPFVDANMRELNATGFMSNRGRQNVASLLLHRGEKPDLSVWWPWGAAYLESQLIDYDPASNWGNWNMVAEVGADAHGDRYFNIYTQATRYDPQGEYVKRWCPELAQVPADKLHLLSLNSAQDLASWGVELGVTYPFPLVNPLKWTRRKQELDRNLFPFTSHYLSIDGNLVHYVDEGEGPTLLLLHGNPTWSFLYRHMIRQLAPYFRCIALDYPGFGLSTAKAGYGFTPREHSGVVEALVDQLRLRDLCIMVQDWGGPIGLGFAGRRPDLVRSLIIGNTWAWPAKGGMVGFSLVFGNLLARFLITRYNILAKWLIPAGTNRQLTKAERCAYMAPFSTPASRLPTWVFPKQIRASKAYLTEVEAGLARLRDKPALVVWGEADGAFGQSERLRLLGYFPNHRVQLLPNAKHFIQENAPDEICAAILESVR